MKWIKSFVVGDKVITYALPSDWWYEGEIIEIDYRNKIIKLKHPNGEIRSYGFRQIKEIKNEMGKNKKS